MYLLEIWTISCKKHLPTTTTISFSCVLNTRKGSAGWNWLVGYKERYGLSLRTPENLSSGRAICSNPTILADFYENLETILLTHDLVDRPDKIWNGDETGLMYVNKPTKIVTKMGKKYVYNRKYAEKGTTSTVLACINAAGHFLPPFSHIQRVPTRFDFHEFLTPVYMKSFTPSNIIGGFRKTGIYPLNKNALCSEAIAPSTLSDKPVPTEQV
ncbi:unnamed protein product, partial [Brenthis ino]